MATKAKTVEDVFDTTGLQLGTWPTHLRDAAGSYLQGVQAAAQTIVRSFEAEAVRLRESGDFSAPGMTKALVVFADQELTRLEQAAVPQISKARNEVTKLTEALAAIPGAASFDPVVLVDTRRHLLEIPDLERRTIILTAVKNGEQVVVDAILQAPVFLQKQLLPLGLTIAELKNTWANGRSPEAALRLRQLQECIQLAERALELARHLILHSSGIDADTRRELAAKLAIDPLNVALRK